MNMKQVVSLLLGATLCLPLTACGGGKVSEESAPETSLATESMVPTETVPATETAPETQAPTEAPTMPALSLEDSDFVAVKDYIPDIYVELKYAAADNFTGQVIYDFQDAYLRYGTVKKLMEVQEDLRALGLGLKIWDSYRPRSAQFRLWEVFPDDTYVANPETGNSNHSRGNAVDVTLVDVNGNELEMPSEFDDFSGKADREYSDCSDQAAHNSGILQRFMEKHGFKGYSAEWWHYSDTVKYDVEEVFDPASVSVWFADCNEFLSLRTEPDTGAEAITRIPARGEVTVLGYSGDFAMVEYDGLRGYVLQSYLLPLGQTMYADCNAFISLRTAPDTAAEVITRIPVKGQMTLLGYEGDFARVDYQGQQGYVLASYIQPVS